jgi:hypothetical protein
MEKEGGGVAAQPAMAWYSLAWPAYIDSCGLATRHYNGSSSLITLVLPPFRDMGGGGLTWRKPLFNA